MAPIFIFSLLFLPSRFWVSVSQQDTPTVDESSEEDTVAAKELHKHHTCSAYPRGVEVLTGNPGGRSTCLLESGW